MKFWGRLRDGDWQNGESSCTAWILIVGLAAIDVVIFAANAVKSATG
jgi:hypothetical protein